MRRVLLFGLAGLIVTLLCLAVEQRLPQQPGHLLVWMSAAAAAGFVLRAIRRKAFLHGRASLHKSFSFDITFQGAILLNPQLSYPAVEREFLSLQTGLPAEQLAPWFEIRMTSAVAIPLLLAGVVLQLAGQTPWAVGCWATGLGWLLTRTYRSGQAFPGHSRIAAAGLSGGAAAIVEGILFTAAATLAYPESTPWGAYLAYAVVLTAFELSPAPLALGTLELGLLCTSALLPAGVLPGLFVAVAYRLTRAVAAVLLAVFYLPRYKMSVRDLFDTSLARVLAGLRRRHSGSEQPRGGGPFLSVVIPAYNEALRLPRYLPDVVGYCEGRAEPCEVLVVDDGSKDSTADYVEQAGRQHAFVRLVRQPRNMGKGEAVRRGVAEAAGRYILFADADGATPIREADKLLEAAAKGADVVIGSRKAASAAVKRSRSWFRELVGSAFYRVTNLLVVPDVSDTQCGFKLFRRGAARRIFPMLAEKGWAFDVEVLFLAQKLGMVIEEVPVNWSEVEGSKVGSLDAWRMLLALIRVRRRNAGLTGPLQIPTDSGVPGEQG
jgi:dolichyl-phosphate beta-glucosyltransferase